MRHGRRSRATRAALALLFAAAAQGPTRGADDDFFERRIRPVLAERCLGCHGPDAAKAGLRLDSREALMKGSDAGPVVIPGDPENSTLVEAVRRAGPLKMPPKTPLAPEAVADLTDWVRRGLPWPEAPRPAPRGASSEADPSATHWAFRAPRAPAVPTPKRPGAARTTVDAFLLDRLDRAGLGLAPEADRRTLIRRLAFDLTGLPPTPDEVDAFVADDRPDAYERRVDRLLASPQYGERWARHWLDVARYADTKGYVFFEDADFPWAYTYRDWVTRALNEDLPYDRFVVEQLAADRLPDGPDRAKARAALGFLSLGGRFMNNTHDIIDDRIDAVTRGLMGLTVACARCHDHKYDPIPTADYYALYGVFASTAEPDVPPLLDPPPDTDAYRKFDAELRAREAKLAAFVDEKHAALVASAKTRADEYLLAAQSATDRPSTGDFMLIADGGDLNPTMIVRWQSFLERARRRSSPAFAPWFALAALEKDGPNAGASDAAPRVLRALRDDPARPVNPWVLDALIEANPRSLAEAARVYRGLITAVDAIGRERAARAALEGRGADPGPWPIPAMEELWRVVRGPESPADLPPGAISRLELLPDRASQATLQALQKAVETWRATGPGAPPRAMAMVDLPRPVEPRVFVRGNPNNLGPAVSRHAPRVLTAGAAADFSDGSGRLELARAIASPDNPLTARVIVNRVWAHHMGAPLVATPGDFGLRSDPPTHPELLDHLAATFVTDDRWSLKALHRRIVLSAAYRQSSADRPDARAADPENRLYARANRRRLDFEALRDAVLAVSGRLDRAVGGPPMPAVADPKATRRTLYAKVDRLNLPGLFRTFDFPDPNATSAGRDATTVAPQALFLMNHPFLIAAAEALATRPDVAGAPDPKARLTRVYRLAVGRAPGDAEAAAALAYAADPEGGWARLCQALLLSNEFLFID